MPDFKAPGLYAENRNPDPHIIRGVSTSVAAFVGYTSSGPDTPTLLASFTDYTSIFGGTTSSGGPMALAVQGFFDNGGTQLYVSRVNWDSVSPARALVPLEALGDISMICCPDENNIAGVAAALVAHCEAMQYRIAILAAPQGSDLENLPPAELRSAFAAYYAPWVLVPDPNGGSNLTVHPGGHIAGAIVRNDVERGVSKAPANLAVYGIDGLERHFTDEEQRAVSMRGVNLLRTFPGRGNLVWGAHTTSTDPQWKYLNVRRYLSYLEKSIDQGLQWVVFENNGPALWASVQQSVANFLQNEWLSGALLGGAPAEAYFVRCDRTTMTQDDLDNGRLVCLVGVAVLKPAEFIIFRIGQWTSDATCT